MRPIAAFRFTSSARPLQRHAALALAWPSAWWRRTSRKLNPPKRRAAARRQAYASAALIIGRPGQQGCGSKRAAAATAARPLHGVARKGRSRASQTRSGPPTGRIRGEPLACLTSSEQAGRVCRGLELDPLYVEVIIRRYEAATAYLPSVLKIMSRSKRWRRVGGALDLSDFNQVKALRKKFKLSQAELN
jgi:hypothetical protein